MTVGPGRYCFTLVDGRELLLQRDGRTWLLIETGTRRPDPEWRRHNGHWVREATDVELDRAFQVRFRGSYHGVEVHVEQLPNGRLVLFATATPAALEVGMQHSNKYEASLEVDPDTPGIRLTQSRHPLRLRR